MTIEQSGVSTLDQAVTMQEVADAFAYSDRVEKRQVLDPSNPDDVVLLQRWNVSELLDSFRMPVSGSVYASAQGEMMSDANVALFSNMERDIQKLKRLIFRQAKEKSEKAIEDIRESINNITSKLREFESRPHEERIQELERLHSLMREYIPRAEMHLEAFFEDLSPKSDSRIILSKSIRELKELEQKLGKHLELALQFDPAITLRDIQKSIDKSKDELTLRSGESIDYLRRIKAWVEKAKAYEKKAKLYLRARAPNWRKDFPEIKKALRALFAFRRGIERKISRPGIESVLLNGSVIPGKYLSSARKTERSIDGEEGHRLEKIFQPELDFLAGKMGKGDYVLLADVSQKEQLDGGPFQQLYWVRRTADGFIFEKRFIMSGSKVEPGKNVTSSFSTPYGLHKIASIVKGDFASVIKGRRVQRRKVENISTGDARILTTAALYLKGLERGINDLSNPRGIAIHGTPFERRLGRPASHGCIWLSNADILNLLEMINRNPEKGWAYITDQKNHRNL